MSALDNTFEEINSVISGVDEFFEFNPDWINMRDTFFLDLTGQNIGVANIEPTEALDISGNMKVDGYINQIVSGAGTPFTLYFPNNKDGGFYYDYDNDNVYLCYNHTGELFYSKFNNESFDRLQNTFSEIDAAISGVNSLSVGFDDIDSGIGFVLDLNYNSTEVNSSIALANTSLQISDNVSDLVNDVLYVASGDNVSDLVNDALYVASGDNVSDLVNDALYVASGDNVSDLVNDALYVASGDNVSDLVNDALYVASGDNVSDLVNDALYRSLNFHTETGASYTAGINNETIILADASNTSININLPAVASSANTEFIIKAIDITNTITIDSNASEAIDGSISPITPFVTQYDSINIACDGSQWWIIA